MVNLGWAQARRCVSMEPGAKSPDVPSIMEGLEVT